MKKKNSVSGKMTRFFINLGKIDELNPVQLIGMVNDYTGIRSIKIGEIEIKKNFSFFEADNTYTDQIIKKFKGKKLNARAINVEVAEKRKQEANNKRNKKSDKTDFKKRSFSKTKRRKRK
jgi:ATP-dependent RNA helicase DeaD